MEEIRIILRTVHVVCVFISALFAMFSPLTSTCGQDGFHSILPYPLLLILVGFYQATTAGILVFRYVIPFCDAFLLCFDSSMMTLIGVSLIHGDSPCEEVYIYRMLVAFFIYYCIRVATLTVTIGLSLFRFKMIIEWRESLGDLKG